MTLGDPEDRMGNLWSWLLQAFAEQTLRTLCLAYKDVEEDAYKEWEPEHQEAALLLQNRAQALHQVYNKMEQNLQVGGWGGVGPAAGLLLAGPWYLNLRWSPSAAGSHRH